MTRLAACVLILVGTGNAAAQHARYPRQQVAPTPPVLSDRVKPIAPKPAQVAAKPSIDADVVLSIDGLRGAIRSEQEQILAELVNNTPDSEVEEKADYYFRLGELCAKQHRFWRMKSSELAATSKQESAQAAEKAKLYLLKAVKTFKAFTDTERFVTYRSYS